MASLLQKDNLERCVGYTLHHVAEHKFSMMSRMSTDSGPVNLLSVVENYYKMIRREQTKALEQIKKIRAAAMKANCKEVLDLLDEKFEF